MNQVTKKNILLAYALISLFILLAWLFLSHGPVWHRNVLDVAQQELPLRWYEYFRAYLGIILLPAFYGLFAFIPRNKLSMNQDSGFGYFMGALSIGMVTSLIAWFGSMFWRLDCNNVCAAYVPSYVAIKTTLALAALTIVLIPAILTLMFRPLKK